MTLKADWPHRAGRKRFCRIADAAAAIGNEGNDFALGIVRRPVWAPAGLPAGFEQVIGYDFVSARAGVSSVNIDRGGEGWNKLAPVLDLAAENPGDVAQFHDRRRIILVDEELHAVHGDDVLHLGPLSHAADLDELVDFLIGVWPRGYAGIGQLADHIGQGRTRARGFNDDTQERRVFGGFPQLIGFPQRVVRWDFRQLRANFAGIACDQVGQDSLTHRVRPRDPERVGLQLGRAYRRIDNGRRGRGGLRIGRLLLLLRLLVRRRRRALFIARCLQDDPFSVFVQDIVEIGAGLQDGYRDLLSGLPGAKLRLDRGRACLGCNRCCQEREQAKAKKRSRHVSPHASSPPCISI